MKGDFIDEREAADNVASISDHVEKLTTQIEKLNERKEVLRESSQKRDALMAQPILQVNLRIHMERGGYIDILMSGSKDRVYLASLSSLLATMLTDRSRDCMAAIDSIAAEIHTPPL